MRSGGFRNSLRAITGAVALGLLAAVGFLAMWPSGARSEIRPTGRPPAAPDLAVLVEWSTYRVLIGGSLSFQILVTNDGSPPLGPVPARAVVRVSITNGTITGINTINSGFSCLSESRVPREAVCRRETPMAPGTAVTFTVSVQAPSQPGPITATATASLPTSLPDKNPTNNSSTRVAQVYSALIPDLTVSIAGLPDPVVGLSDVAYSLDVRNAGSGDATGVTVRHTLPAGATFVRAGSGCTHGSGVVRCTLGTLPAGRTTHVTVVSRAPSGPGSATYTAAVDPVAGEQVTTNNSAVVIRLNVGPADLIPIASGTPFSLAGGPPTPFGIVERNLRGVTLHVKVKNQGSGPAPATHLRIELLSSSSARFLRDDICPPGMRFMDGDCVSQTPPSCSLSGSGATCSIPSLAAGASSGPFVVSVGFTGSDVRLSFTVRADADNAVAESNEGNNFAVLEVTWR